MPVSPEPHSDRIPFAANATCCSKTFFEKLAKYIGHGIKRLIDRPDGRYCFRLHNNRVYYVSEALLKHASALPRDKLHQIGCTFGKFTKTGKFRLHVTCLDYLAQHAQYKVWLKPSAEQSFLYGNHVLKAGLGRITEDTPQYQGVIVLNMADVPLGFGTAAKSTAELVAPKVSKDLPRAKMMPWYQVQKQTLGPKHATALFGSPHSPTRAPVSGW